MYASLAHSQLGDPECMRCERNELMLEFPARTPHSGTTEGAAACNTCALNQTEILRVMRTLGGAGADTHTHTHSNHDRQPYNAYSTLYAYTAR